MERLKPIASAIYQLHQAYKESPYGKRREFFERYGDYSQKNLLPTSTSMPYKRLPRPRKSLAKKAPRFARAMTTGSSRSRVPAKTVQTFNAQTTGRVTRRKKRVSRKPVRLQLAQVRKIVEADQATHTYKSITRSGAGCAIGECSHTDWTVNTISDIETAIANFRYYNPADPANLTTASAATGTYSRLIHMRSVYGKLEIRNNYQVPCKVKVYLVKPKGDTNIAPVTYYNNGITDQVLGFASPDHTTPGLNLSDIDVFKDQWSIKVLKDVILEAGAQTTVSHSVQNIEYDPSLADAHTVAYQTKWKNFGFIIRIEGVIAHDTTAGNELSTLQARVDVFKTVKFVFNYDAGTSLNDIYLVDARPTAFTNGGVITNKPIADNQDYSQS